jgi:hypothetical protein
MANREQRGGREKRKPKAEKPKAPPAGSSFARPSPAANIGKTGGGGKKGR